VTKFTRSAGYVRARAVTGTLFIAFGTAIIVRTIFAIGLVTSAIVPVVMGAALIALGIIRLRDYIRLRGTGA
jgi:hypothetical protein